jgi:GNAT superfamily N-acetyltransferase
MSDPHGVPSIREAAADDAVRLHGIARAAYAKYVPRIGREPAPMLADYHTLIAAGLVVVIEQASQPLGYLIAWPEADAYVIDNIAIDPARQGQGLGRQLMEHAIAQARRLNLPALRLYTNAVMTENLAIYGHMGFVETHRAVNDGYDRIFMQLVV